MSKIENQKFDITGMTCASCSAHVTKAVSKVKGVNNVNVNLLTNSMLVSYDEPASPSIISEAVSKAGYGASLSKLNQEAVPTDNMAIERKEIEDHETPRLLKRLIVSLILLIPLFYLGMGYMNMSWNWPLGALRDNPFYFALTEMLISFVILIVNKAFFITGTKTLFHGGPNMDTLVALGAGTAFLYSIVLLFIMSHYVMNGDTMKVMETSMHLSFETAGMVPTLITIGKTLESYSKGKTTNAIKSLMDLAPKEAHVIRDGKEITIPAAEVRTDETLIVRPGESFPVDGIVLEGESSVNEAALTGESMPVDKTVGNVVSAATINQNGSLKVKATKVGNETTLHHIIEMVQTAAGTKTKISRIADTVSGVFVPVVLGIALVVFLGWMIFGRNYVSSNFDDSTLTFVTYALQKSVAILVVACPCALGLATPVAIMVGSGKSARNGILFKTASALEETGKINFVVLDKTGTLTKGAPVVTDIVPNIGYSENDLLIIASSLEAKSEHPLAKAIREKSKERNVELEEVLNFKTLPGHGIQAEVRNQIAIAGNAKLMSDYGILSAELKQESERLADEGKTPLFFALGNQVIGLIAVADVLKDDSKKAIQEFEKLGVTSIMLTGDNHRTATAIAKQLGLKNFISDVLPDGKQAVIKKLQKYGKVAMVGDGINDAPALTQADIGIAIGAGADVAIDSADVVLMKSTLMDAVAAIRLSRHTLLNIKENLFWAFFYNVVMIPLVAGVFAGTGNAFLRDMQPWYGAAAMAISSVTVCLNALRINLYDAYRFRRTGKKQVELPSDFFAEQACPVIPDLKPQEKQKKEIVLVGGMMCENCVAHVKEALESLKGVSHVEVSLEKGEAVVEMDESVQEESLKKAIESSGYEFGGIKEPFVMKKRIEVPDMMCENCIEHVTKALNALDGVEKADVSLETLDAVVTLSKDVSDETLKKAIQDADYQVGKIELLK
jgi:Cu2+-exporting ATPase